LLAIEQPQSLGDVRVAKGYLLSIQAWRLIP